MPINGHKGWDGTRENIKSANCRNERLLQANLQSQIAQYRPKLKRPTPVISPSIRKKIQTVGRTRRPTPKTAHPIIVCHLTNERTANKLSKALHKTYQYDE